jgi:chromosome segregation ATPase
MYSELNKKLEEARQKIYRLNKIDSILAELRNDAAELRQKVYELKEVLDKENLDVEKLDNTNVVSIFYSIIGKLEDKKEKEQREALSARLKYEQASYDLLSIEAEISKLTQEQESYKGCINEFNSLYEQKKELIIKSCEASANKILELTNKINESKRNLKELKEAISA